MQPSCPCEPACTDLSVCPAHPLLFLSSPSNFSIQFIQLKQRGTGLKNMLIPSLAERQSRGQTLSLHTRKAAR